MTAGSGQRCPGAGSAPGRRDGPSHRSAAAPVAGCDGRVSNPVPAGWTSAEPTSAGSTNEGSTNEGSTNAAGSIPGAATPNHRLAAGTGSPCAPTRHAVRHRGADPPGTTVHATEDVAAIGAPHRPGSPGIPVTATTWTFVALPARFTRRRAAAHPSATKRRDTEFGGRPTIPGFRGAQTPVRRR